GCPSTYICGAAFLSFTFPSISTCTEGTLRITSTAVPPALTIFFSTLKTFLSISIFKVGALPTTVTPANVFTSVSSLILPRSLSNGREEVEKDGLPPAADGAPPEGIFGIANETLSCNDLKP